MNEVENDDIEIVINLCISVNLSSSITRWTKSSLISYYNV
jgi:hypothetical protein